MGDAYKVQQLKKMLAHEGKQDRGTLRGKAYALVWRYKHSHD